MKRCERCGQFYEERIETCADCGSAGRLVPYSEPARPANGPAPAGMSWARVIVSVALAGIAILIAAAFGETHAPNHVLQWVPVLVFATRILALILAAAGVLYLVAGPASMQGAGASSRLLPGGALLLGAATLAGEGSWAVPLAFAMVLVVPLACRAFGRRDPEA